MPKPRLTPRSKPESPIEILANEFSKYLHFPDPTPLYALMGCVAANMIPGNPVWLMLVGSPACGKTELLNSLLGLLGVHNVGAINGPATLLSGVPSKDRSAQATGGLLREVGDRGAFVFKDFTSMLSLPNDSLKTTLGALREIYDGKWDRPIGGEGGLHLWWEGKVALFAGCTQAIDRHHMVTNEMGERWIYYRYPPSDGWGESRKALQVAVGNDERKKLQEVVRALFEGMGLYWGGDNQQKRSLTKREEIRIIGMATFASRARSAIHRNPYTREIDDVPQAESPTRLATVLGQLYHGLDILGLPKPQSWDVLGRIALDCMPQTRRVALDCVRLAISGQADYNDILETMKTSPSTTTRVLEDLVTYGVLQKIHGKRAWTLTDWSEEELKNGWG